MKPKQSGYNAIALRVHLIDCYCEYYSGIMSVMKQTIALKLQPEKGQYQSLLCTVEAFNDGCQFVAQVAFEQQCANKVILQQIVYRELRERFGLSSQMAIRAISKVVETYKRDKAILPVFDRHGAMVYDERVMSFKGVSHVSLLTLDGRVIVPLRFGAYQAGRMDRIKGQADLILRNGVFYLYATIDLPEPPPADMSGGVLGVDLGIVEIATDSEANSYSGEQVKSIRCKLKEHRRQLQRRQTNSAKKRLRSIARKQSRFVRDTNHCISKQIVQTACDSLKAIALETLIGIRERTVNLGRNMRWLLGNWSFYQLRAYITYKAMQVGIDVIEVNPRNTSRTCSSPSCGYCDKANRKSQWHFKCLKCGFQANADYNASCNIARLGLETRAKMSVSLMSSAFAEKRNVCSVLA